MSNTKPILNFILSDNRWNTLIPSLKPKAEDALQKASEDLKTDFSRLEISLVLTENQEVQALNKSFRGKDNPTNVLSFPCEEKDELGDIILAYETVVQEASDQGIPPLHHTLHLIIHGFLHLLGYDHRNDQEAEKMEGIEIRILNSLKIPNPYEDL